MSAKEVVAAWMVMFDGSDSDDNDEDFLPRA